MSCLFQCFPLLLIWNIFFEINDLGFFICLFVWLLDVGLWMGLVLLLKFLWLLRSVTLDVIIFCVCWFWVGVDHKIVKYKPIKFLNGALISCCLMLKLEWFLWMWNLGLSLYSDFRLGECGIGPPAWSCIWVAFFLWRILLLWYLRLWWEIWLLWVVDPVELLHGKPPVFFNQNVVFMVNC